MKFHIYYKKPCEHHRMFTTEPNLSIYDVLYGDEFAKVRSNIEADNLDNVFRMMQGEVWSPNGEARSLIRGLGLAHTSMSVGDVIISEDEKRGWQCDRVGWLELTNEEPPLKHFRCTRQRPYDSPGCPGHKDPSARQGYYMDCYNEKHAEARMIKKFPGDIAHGFGFDIQPWH